MDTDDWVMAMCIADEERRRAKEQAQEEMEELREEYDEWCEDHGIDPPPRREPEAQKGAGCLCLPVILGCCAVATIFAFFVW